MPFSVGAVAASLVCLLPTILVVAIIVESRRVGGSLADGVANVVLLMIAAPAFVVGVVVLSVVVACGERRGAWLLGVSLGALVLSTLVRVLDVLL
jgi:hypothetical protein